VETGDIAGAAEGTVAASGNVTAAAGETAIGKGLTDAAADAG
jgi:hypothetical protein